MSVHSAMSAPPREFYGYGRTSENDLPSMPNTPAMPRPKARSGADESDSERPWSSGLAPASRQNSDVANAVGASAAAEHRAERAAGHNDDARVTTKPEISVTQPGAHAEDSHTYSGSEDGDSEHDDDHEPDGDQPRRSSDPREVRHRTVHASLSPYREAGVA